MFTELQTGGLKLEANFRVAWSSTLRWDITTKRSATYLAGRRTNQRPLQTEPVTSSSPCTLKSR